MNKIRKWKSKGKRWSESKIKIWAVEVDRQSENQSTPFPFSGCLSARHISGSLKT
nr:hypothetical protein [uncultured Kingella sp.]